MVNGHGVHTNKKYTTFHMITTENQLDTSAKRSQIMFSLFYIRLVWSDDYLLLEIIIGYSSLLQGAGKILIKKEKKNSWTVLSISPVDPVSGGNDIAVLHPPSV